MVGFINAVGVNIILGQLANFTGYSAEGANRVVRALVTLAHPGRIQLETISVGIVTILLILALERTRLGPIGLVVAVVATSAAVTLLGWQAVITLNDLTDVPRSLPGPVAPSLQLIPVLIVPALSLAFVGLVQGASISSNFPNPDGSYGDPSRDFVGQGAANVAVGVFQGMPVGGSVSASALNKEAGARSKWSLVVASLVMAIVILAFAEAVGRTSRCRRSPVCSCSSGTARSSPADLQSVWRTGVGAEGRARRHLHADDDHPVAVLGAHRGRRIGDLVRRPPVQPAHRATLAARRTTARSSRRILPRAQPAGDVVVLQPYGSLFFAASPMFDALLPPSRKRRGARS